MKRFLLVLTMLALLPFKALSATFPVTVASCDREVTFDQPPQRVVSHDINMTGMLLALGLRDRMVGYTGISGWKTMEPSMARRLEGLPELAARYPSVETLLDADVDLWFAGWNYGMRVGGPVTPALLEPFGIAVYELSESCSRIMDQRKASLEDLYRDLLNLGSIFAVTPRAEELVSGMRERVNDVEERVGGAESRPRVFLYDSGEDRPTTSGRLGMPQALIEAAAGRNIMDDVGASWTQVNWESIVERDPQVIVIVDYGPTSWEQKRDFLLRHPALGSVEAIQQQRFVVLPYVAVTPSVDNAEAVEVLARALHPQLFAEASQ